MKSRRSRRRKSKFKSPLTLSLAIVSAAAFSFGLGSYISHASVTLNGSGVTASSTSGNFLELTSSTTTLFGVDNQGNIGANQFYGSTVSSTPYPNLSFTSSGGLDLNAGGTNQNVTLKPSGTGTVNIGWTSGTREVAGAPLASDAIQYVSASGNDANDGLSWGRAKATIGAACAALPGGTSDCHSGSGMIVLSPSYSGSRPSVVSSMIEIVSNSAESGYLISSFDITQNLVIGYSADGTAFQSYSIGSRLHTYAPAGGVRDPSIMWYRGKFWVCYTIANTSGAPNQTDAFGIASSPDLVNWTLVADVNPQVSGEGAVWAPEWFVDTDGSVHISVAVKNGSSGAYALYTMSPIDTTGLTTWTTATPFTWTDSAPLAPWDPFIIKIGSTYYLWYSDQSYVNYATSSNLGGPYTQAHPDGTNWTGFPTGTPGQEGPSLVEPSTGTWRLYLAINNALYYSQSTDDFATWSTPVQVVNAWSANQSTVIPLENGTESEIVHNLAASYNYSMTVGNELVFATPQNDSTQPGINIGGMGNHDFYIIGTQGIGDYLRLFGGKNDADFEGKMEIMGNNGGGSGSDGSPVSTLDIHGPSMHVPTTFSTLPACSSTTAGEETFISDSTTQTWGATVAGGGSLPALILCDGTNWTVIGK